MLTQTIAGAFAVLMGLVLLLRRERIAAALYERDLRRFPADRVQLSGYRFGVLVGGLGSIVIGSLLIVLSLLLG